MPPVPGPLLKELHLQLTNAFPDLDDLSRMVRFSLTEVLASIVPPGAGQSVHFGLLAWVERNNRWPDFLAGVREVRPGMPALLAAVDHVTSFLNGGPAPGPGAAPPPPPSPTPRGWPLLLPNGYPFVDRLPVQGAVQQMARTLTPRVLRIGGLGLVGKTYCIPYLLQEIRQQRPADRVAVLDLSKFQVDADLPAQLAEDVLYYWGSAAQVPPAQTGQVSSNRRVTGLARFLPQALPAGGGDGWVILDGFRGGQHAVLADFVEALGTVAMNGSRVWLVLVGYNRPFSSAVLETYCQDLQLAPITASDLGRYFTQLIAYLDCAAHPSATDVVDLVAEYGACRPGDEVSVEILRTGVRGLARRLAGLV
jgi:hypothetical protein